MTGMKEERCRIPAAPCQTIAEPVWRELIERSIDHELAAFDRQAAGA